jgi:hypothetical protein
MVKKLSVITCFVLVLGISGSGQARTEINEPSYNLSFEYDSNGNVMRCSTRVGCGEAWDPDYVSHCGVMAWKENEVNWPIVEMECSQSGGGDDCDCHAGVFASDGICDLTIGQWSATDTNLIVWQSLDPAYDANVIIKPDYEYRITFDSFRWQENYLTFYFYYGNISDNNWTNPDVNTIAEFEVVVGVEPWETVTYSFIAEPDQPYIGKPLGLRFYQRGQGWHWIDNVRVDWRALSIEVAVDIKPGSCRNPVNVYSRGVLPIAVLGSADLDVSDINAASVRLNGVPAIRYGYEDVGTAVLNGEECECSRDGGDGYLDLTLKFETQEIVSTFGEVNDGDVLALSVSGVLVDETPIEGSDCIVIRGKRRPF